MAREYPERPHVAVGVVLLEGDGVLLIQRARNPGAGRWTVPGGGVDVGENLHAAALRELREETGLEATLGPIVEVCERIVADEAGKTLYHNVIIDFLGTAPNGQLRAGDDACDARWVPIDELSNYETTDGLGPVIERARALREGQNLPPHQPDAPFRQ